MRDVTDGLTGQFVNSMNKEKLLNILNQGVKTWNHWRLTNPQVHPDLSLMNLSAINLSQAYLQYANLSHTKFVNAVLSDAYITDADISFADLSGADLRNADLSYTNLRNAKLNQTNLSHSKLIRADLEGANLTGAMLVQADLRWANVSGTILDKVDMSLAQIGWTMFGKNDLSVVKGIESLDHHGPSNIGIDTVYLSSGNIPELFLRSAGVPDNFITFMTSLTQRAIKYYSCFLSHADQDNDFADRLRNDLASNAVSCWHYRYDMRGGRFWRAQVEEAIKIHNKLVLVCSERSLERPNVVGEIITAMEKERETNSQKLFPIRLDDFILSDKMLDITD
jgi:TIR domain-containing protein/pentapeptide repeat protein